MTTVDLLEMRSSAATLMAAAVHELFPNVLLVEGRGLAMGFYYDFSFPFAFQKEFIPLIEERMKKLLKERAALKHFEMVPSNADAFLKHRGQSVRAEIAGSQRSSIVQMVQWGEFADYWEHEHPFDWDQIGAFKITEASEKQDVVRIVGTAFEDKESLKSFLKKKVNIGPLDFLQLAKELNLFTPTEEEYVWLWHPKGEILRRCLVNFWESENSKQNFQFVSTPVSGDMTENHLLIYKATGSMRLAECGQSFDRAHILCSEEQLLEESISSLQFLDKILKILRFEYQLVLCAHGSGYNRTRTAWKESVSVLKKALSRCGLEYLEDQCTNAGEGPIVEARIQDAFGKECSGPYLKLDCIHANEFGLKAPVIVRSIFNSLERTVALLLEKTEGTLPFWLAPEQVRIFALGGQAEKSVAELCKALETLGVRVKKNCRIEALSQRMHEALKERIPYTVIIGERELASGTVTVRDLSKEENRMSPEALVEMLNRKDFEN